MTLARVGTFTTYMTHTLLEKEFNNIACHFGKITASELNIASNSTLIDYYRGDPDDDLVTNIANAVTAKRPLYLPAGTHTINNLDATCNIPDGMIIRGAGIDRTILLEKAGNTAVSLLTIGSGALTGKNVYISNLTIQHSADLGVNAHLHDVGYINIVGTEDAYVVLNRIKFDTRDYAGTEQVNALLVDDSISDLRHIYVQQCIFNAPYYCDNSTGFAIYATECPLKLTITDSVFIGWKIAIDYGDTTPSALQFLTVINCYFILISSGTAASSHAIVCNGGALIQGNVFSSNVTVGTCSYFIYAVNNGITTTQIIGNMMYSTSVGPATGVAILGDNFVVMDLIESSGSAGFTSGLMQLTGLDADAANCWWDGITALDSTQDILPDACTKRGARSLQYPKTRITGYENLLRLELCELTLHYASPYNYVNFTTVRPGFSSVRARIRLVGATNIAD